MYGYAGKILTVNLTDGKVKKEALRDDLINDYIGGEGFGARLLWEKLKPGIDPLSPENILIFSITALSGTNFPSGSRTILCFKSPLTGLYGESSIGGDFGAYLKFAGYDILIIEGKAEKPVYLFIDNEKVEIRDATKLWGKLSSETDELLKEEVGNENVEIIRIGPAGEKLNRLAAITSGYNRAFGKGGVGAVAGVKNLKAIVVRGTGNVSSYKPEEIEGVSSRIEERCRKRNKLLTRAQIHFLTPIFERTVGIPVRHWQQSNWKGGRNLYHDRMMEMYTGEDTFCWKCPAKSGKVLMSKKYGHKLDVKVEAVWAWGHNLMINDLDDLLEIFYLCAQYGVDINGSAEWAGWLAECQERGILTPEDVGGLEVKFGDANSCIKLLKAILKREGFGDILAEGPKIAAEKIGKGSEKYVMHVKGSPIEAEQFRADKALLLGVATQERGGSVNRTWTYVYSYVGAAFPGVTEKRIANPLEEKGIAKMLKAYKEDFVGILNTMGGCFILSWAGAGFGGLTVVDVVEGYKYLTGREISVEEGKKIGERIINLSRAFNAREGFDRKDDTVPERFLKEPVRGGPNDGAEVENFDAMLDEFYTECGLDLKTGWPTKAKLNELGLKDVANELYPRGK
jgi:aldehyde:ferredoxin oxidoreductase